MSESLPGANDFEEIRPYTDDEVRGILEILLEDPSFIQVVQYVFPSWSRDQLFGLLKEISTIKEFQKNLMYAAIHAIADKTIAGLSNSGFEGLVKKEPYLFISNHRDIILDSAILNVMLFEAGLDTCEVAIGSNLLKSPWLTHLVKLNKNFIVHRDIPTKQLFAYSLRLSTYIRNSITNTRSSVWIAQKEGRTKDGNDVTQAGLLKMLFLSGKGDLIGDFKMLNIVPMALSYEYEPCDDLKAREIVIKSQTGTYKKAADEDLKSMLAGITAPKGRFHMAMGTTLNEKLEKLDTSASKNELMKELAGMINREIHTLYKLWPTNYIAFDLLNKDERHADKYDRSEKDTFIAHIEKTAAKVDQPGALVKETLLNMYANPVRNKLKLDSDTGLTVKH